MRMESRILLGLAGLALATQATAQVVYERPAPVIVSQPPVVVADPAHETYQARVISATPVSGPLEQHCWMERKQLGPVEWPGAIVAGIGDALSGQHSVPDDVQRCETVPGATQSWDVLYEFRGVQHRVQLSAPPGPTVAVNGYGDLRG